MTFKHDDIWFTERTLLKQCCESSLMTLKLDAVADELRQLVENGYLDERQTENADAKDQILAMPEGESEYRIDNRGILYVRQMSVKLRDRIGVRTMPRDLIKQQPTAVQEELGRKTLTLNTLIDSGIQNIGPIIKLMEAFLS